MRFRRLPASPWIPSSSASPNSKARYPLPVRLTIRMGAVEITVEPRFGPALLQSVVRTRKIVDQPWGGDFLGMLFATRVAQVPH